MFDLTKLSKKELLVLNGKIIERVNELDAQSVSESMSDFTIGDKVQFSPPGEDTVKGIVIKKIGKPSRYWIIQATSGICHQYIW